MLHRRGSLEAAAGASDSSLKPLRFLRLRLLLLLVRLLYRCRPDRHRHRCPHASHHQSHLLLDTPRAFPREMATASVVVVAAAAQRRYRCRYRCRSWHRRRRTCFPDRPRSPPEGGGVTNLPTLPPVLKCCCCCRERRQRGRPRPVMTGAVAFWLRRRRPTRPPRTGSSARRSRWRPWVPSWKTPRSALARLVRVRTEEGGDKGQNKASTKGSLA